MRLLTVNEWVIMHYGICDKKGKRKKFKFVDLYTHTQQGSIVAVVMFPLAEGIICR